jgi:chitinase
VRSGQRLQAGMLLELWVLRLWAGLLWSGYVFFVWGAFGCYAKMGLGNCTSTCKATAECGQYAANLGKKCPLSVCCSKHVRGPMLSACISTNFPRVIAVQPNCKRSSCTFAYLKTLTQSYRFCDDDCQSGCDKVNRPSGKGESARAKTIGYYESWSYARDCDSVAPRDIDANMWTHIKYV